MPALREAISRFFNPPPGPEAAVMHTQAERLKSAAAELDEHIGEHHDILADLVDGTNDRRRQPRRKVSKRVGSK